MPVEFRNFDFSYKNRKGKPVYVPSDDGRRIGLQVKKLVEERCEFDPFYWHLQKGGHVGAVHAHRDHNWFARIDLKNFFYSISRSRVDRCLKTIGIHRHNFFAKWSSVKNPYDGGGYVLPYGFVQSPILASLAVSHSRLGDYLREAINVVTVGVYLDDISISSNDRGKLEEVFSTILKQVELSGFVLNQDKVAAPSGSMELFNCEVRSGFTQVLEERQAEFYSTPHSVESERGFESYCSSVAIGNLTS